MNLICRREVRVSDTITKLADLTAIYPKTMSLKKKVSDTWASSCERAHVILIVSS